MTDKVVEELDEILDKLCEDGYYVNAYSFQEYPSGIIFGYEDKEEAEKYFERLAIEFENVGIGFIDENDLLKPVGKECIKFKKKGGFKGYFKTEKDNDVIVKKTKTKEIQKEVQETIIRKETIKSFKYGEWGFYISITALILSIITLLLK